MAKQKVVKKAAELLENTVTGDYQPYQSRMWDRPRDLPLFSFFLARTMLWDSTIRLGLRMRSAALQACQFAYKADSTSDQWIPGVEASDEIIGDFVYRQVKRLWENDIDRLLEAQIWGWAAAEVNYRKTRYGQVELDRLVAINPADARLLMKDGEASGVRFSRLGTTGEYDVAFPKAIFHSFNPPPGDPYGVSILMGSISPWADKWLNGGALDVRRLFFVKDAYRGVTLTYPAGRTYSMPDGLTTLSAKELAQQIVEQLKTGGVYTMPYDPDPISGKNMWELKEASVSANPAHILEYPKDLDTEILRGLEIPDDILTAENSGAWQGKMVPMQAFYTGLETWLAALVRDVQRQIIEPLVKLNFGEGHWFEITTKPLATQAMEMQKPPQQQGQPGQPQGMANQDDYAEAFRMGLERAVGSGGVRLSLDDSGHEHKGKGPGVVSLDLNERKFSSTQFNMPSEIANKIGEMAKRIHIDDLAGDGVETESHVTVKYGLHTNNADEVRRIVQNIPPVTIRLANVSVFAANESTVQRGGDAYDVVKIEVESPGLHQLNASISSACECTDTFPDYKPHVTIAYVKPGFGKHYTALMNDMDGVTITLDELVFSGKDRTITTIPLSGPETDSQ